MSKAFGKRNTTFEVNKGMRTSIWSGEVELEPRSSLEKDISAEVVIVGAGMAGILIGHELKRRGISSVILERNRIAGGVTKGTTAKITAQHNLIYHRLITEVGREQARQYALANTRAVERLAEIVERGGIDCDFVRQPAYVYSLDETSLLYDEVKSACSLGIGAEFRTETALPFPVKGAVCFPNQAMMNPLKFIKGVSAPLVVYENTPVTGIEKEEVVTPRGRVKAENIIIASHYPFLDSPGWYFMRMHQQRSYVVALKNAKQLDGMYIDADNMGLSFRNYGDLLLLGGAGHRTGQHEAGGSYAELRRVASQMFPDSEVVAEWSAQDCMSMDGIPYIGRYSPSTPHLYVATGFNKWGMTSSMVSAMILSAILEGKDCEFADVFSPQRFNVTAAAANLWKDGMKAAKGILMERFILPRDRIERLEKGHGGIVEYEGEKVGVYRNEEGEVFIVSPKCTHLGCQLEWNPDELTWDCPCHGSRFSYDGTLLDAPAIDPLPRY